ncbi:unnamed protein product [Staurois parvus]|uniref:Uncharacterized protein n=1 Tax=Staurois parvus TaxID=386267 RepID=A0ABN9H4Z3_9NEOB|nr:unnamed protein product [Staurois parvus]
MLLPDDTELGNNEEDIEAVLEEAAEDFSSPHCHIKEMVSVNRTLVERGFAEWVDSY